MITSETQLTINVNTVLMCHFVTTSSYTRSRTVHRRSWNTFTRAFLKEWTFRGNTKEFFKLILHWDKSLSNVRSLNAKHPLLQPPLKRHLKFRKGVTFQYILQWCIPRQRAFHLHIIKYEVRWRHFNIFIQVQDRKQSIPSTRILYLKCNFPISKPPIFHNQHSKGLLKPLETSK